MAEYLASGRRTGPALMVNDEVRVQGTPIAQEAVASTFRRYVKP
jgi:hypothetical protein